MTGSLAWASAGLLPELEQDNGQEWVLQLGYFGNLQNALNYKDQLVEAGFEAQVISTVEGGEQSFRVIAGFADNPEAFDTLRNTLEDSLGTRGYVRRNPFLDGTDITESAGQAFDQPRRRTLLAQAGNIQPMGGESATSAARSTYESGMFRSPQEQMDSIPGFTAAGLQIIPTLGLSIGYDDNITLVRGNEISSMFYIISPAIRVELPSDHSILALTAGIDIYRYQDSPIDDREPWFVRGDWAWDPSTRQDFNLFAEYGEGADKRGTGRTQGDEGLLPTDLDEWKRLDFGGMWRYGAIGARGKLDLKLGASDLEYTNNREDTYLFDRDWWYGGASFYWRIAPKTSAVVDFLYTDIDYDYTDRDSEETSWMLGITWDATARTSGTLRYGNQEKDFANPEYDDYDGPTWIASVSWRPRSYSMFTLTGSRQTQEPDGNADYVVRQDISLAWTHDWATRFATMVDVGFGEDDYRPDTREDDLFYWSIGARYTFNPHFRFGASVQSYDRDSDIPEYDYKQMIYLLTLEASF